MARHIPRFYLMNKNEAKEGAILRISADQMHHAAGVLRLSAGSEVRIFNEDIGEWKCEISDVKKCLVKCFDQTRKTTISPKKRFTIAFSLINSTKMSFLIEKITELGVTEIVPIISEYTQQRRFNREKARQVAIGACEQSGRLELPKLQEVQTLEAFLTAFISETKSSGNLSSKKLFVADEMIGDYTTESPFSALEDPAFLIGPEGGFSDAERDLFNRCGQNIHRISLGSNILRSETAAIAVAAAAAGILCKKARFIFKR